MLQFQRIATVCALAILAGCGGGGGNTLPHTELPRGVAISPQGGTITLPAISGYTGTLTYPANDAAANASLSVASTTQTGTPLPGTWSNLWLNNPLVSYILVPSSTVTFNGPFTLTVNLGTHMPPVTMGAGTVDFSVSGFDLTAQRDVLSGSAFYPRDISGTTVTFSVQETYGGPLTLTAAHTYQFVINYLYTSP